MSFPVIHFHLHQSGLALSMYISCFFVLISFALGSQRKPSFQWNTELSSILKQCLLPGSWILMRHVSCILLLEWSTTSQRLWVYRISVPYAQKDPRFLFEKRRGQPREFWSLVSTIDGSTLPQDCVEEQLC